MTNYNVEQKDLYGEMDITAEHVQNNRSVRGMLGQRGIKPESLPPAEDIKKELSTLRDDNVMSPDLVFKNPYFLEHFKVFVNIRNMNNNRFF